MRNPTYQRLVFSTKKCIDEQQVFIDYIEINSRMLIKSEQLDINEISEVFILFGLATLYACACPIATIVVILHNIIDMRMDLFINYSCIRRRLAETATNIGPWMNITEFMATVAVISNCLLLYFSSPRLRSFIAENIGPNYEDTYMLWIILGVEHVILAIKYFFQAIMADMPGWVDKSLKRIKHE